MDKSRGAAVGALAALALLAVLALAGSPASVLAASASASPPVPTTLTVPMIADPGSINPILATDSYGRSIVSMLYPSLAAPTPSGRVAPLLARSWAVGKDGLRLVIQLRGGLFWTDGAPVTARDVAATFTAMANRRDHSPYYALFGAVRGIAATTKSEVTVTLSRPDASLARSLVLVPIAPASVLAPLIGRTKALAANADLNLRARVTAGPFRLVSWDQGTGTLVFARNAAYPWGAARLSRLTLQYEPTADAAWQAFVSGQVGIANVPSDARAQARSLAKSGRITLTAVPTAQFTYIAFNMKDVIWTDARVRLAAVEAVDRPAIARALGLSPGTPTGGPPPLSLVASQGAMAGLTYDLARAERLLAAAGWQPGPSGVRYKDHRPLAFTLLTVAGVPLWDRYVGIVAYDLRLAGFDVDVEYQTFALLSQSLAAPPGPNAPGAWALAWNLTPTSDARALFGGASEFPPAGQDIGMYQDRVVTAALDTLAVGGTGAARRAAERRLKTALRGDPPAIFLYQATGLVATLPNLSVPAPAAAGGASLAWPQDWYFRKS